MKKYSIQLTILILVICLNSFLQKPVETRQERQDFEFESESDDKLNDAINKLLNENDQNELNENELDASLLNNKPKSKPRSNENSFHFPYYTTNSISQQQKQPSSTIKKELSNQNEHELQHSNSWTIFFILCVLGMYIYQINFLSFY